MSRARVPGPVEAAVLDDLGRLKSPPVGPVATLTEMATRLARTIDEWQLDAGSAASLSALTKAHQELRATMAVLWQVADDGDDDGFSDRMSTAVRDAEIAG